MSTDVLNPAETAAPDRFRRLGPAKIETPRTLWGLRLHELHDRFWAARGVQVIRQGEVTPLDERAELYLLIEPTTLVIFKLRPVVERLSWLKPRLMYVRVEDRRDRGYREHIATKPDGEFLRFERQYKREEAQRARVALTPDASVARLWQSKATPAAARCDLRRHIDRRSTTAAVLNGSIFQLSDPEDSALFLRTLIEQWEDPSASIEGLRPVEKGVWAEQSADVDRSTRFIGRTWIGAGRQLDGSTPVVGPAWLWDAPDASATSRAVDFDSLEPARVFADVRQPKRKPSSLNMAVKRGFDFAFASLALLVTLPLFPFIMLAIWLEDRGPFFFAHERETIGGRTFPCLKFRSMRTDAEQIKAKLMEQNGADGPQFFMKDDPRLTRVGKFLRTSNLDELPQLFNVLAGHMSLVGPRPSPFGENQCCPEWREARLSVRPGITGLWQIMRSREPGLDFQEWIRYDVQYVERVNLMFDLWIICKTVPIVLKGLRPR